MAQEERSVGRLALILEYDGGNYNGFQSQKGVPTIQDELETAIGKLSGERVRVRGASRTDTGVHAKGQVVDFLTRADFPEEVWIRALNYHLPWDIKVQQAVRVPEVFHSRRDARSRTYRYSILNRETRSPLLQRSSAWIRQMLNEKVMGQASAELVGVHNFSAFCSPLPPEKSAVRRVISWNVWREGEMVRFEAKANAFLPHQILRTGGVLVEVGKGAATVSTVKEMLEGSIIGERNFARLPARGLCLERVDYEESPFGKS